MTRYRLTLPRSKAVIALAAVILGVLAVPSPASAAHLDGVFNQGEFVLYEHSGYGGGVYDSEWDGIGSYKNYWFVNTNVQLNDRASSSSNGKTIQMCAYQHAGDQGPFIIHLPFGQTAGPNLGWSYTSLGWANDQLSSHSSHCRT